VHSSNCDLVPSTAPSCHALHRTPVTCAPLVVSPARHVPVTCAIVSCLADCSALCRVSLLMLTNPIAMLTNPIVIPACGHTSLSVDVTMLHACVSHAVCSASGDCSTAHEGGIASPMDATRIEVGGRLRGGTRTHALHPPTGCGWPRRGPDGADGRGRLSDTGTVFRGSPTRNIICHSFTRTPRLPKGFQHCYRPVDSRLGLQPIC
jgi:hypothetical protein